MTAYEHKISQSVVIDGEAAQVVGAREMSPSTIKHSASWREWRALCHEQHYSVRQRSNYVALDREGSTCGVWNNDDGVGYLYVPVRLKDIYDGSLHVVTSKVRHSIASY